MVFNEDYHINMLMSNKDVYIRFDKFQSGEINKLLIPGLSGSGKSTLARELAIRFNCPCIELDKFRGNIYYTDEEMKREHPYIYKYFKTEFTKGDRHNIAKMEPEERREEFEKFVYWLLKQPERMVIEGALEKILYDNDEMRKTYPMVFKGTSMLKSMARMSWREFHRDHPGRDPIDNLLWWMKWCTKYKKMTDQHNKVREKIMGDVDMNDYEEREENDLPLIMEAMGYKPHPIVFSDDDVYINYDKWKSGECTSLLVTGLSGGGKSSLSKKLADDFNAYYVEIDVISFKIGILKPQRANWEYIQKNDKYLYKFLKEYNLPPTIMQQFKNYQDPKKSTIIDKYIYWLCFERDDLDTNRIVIEGGDVAISLTNIKELSNLPIIIKGTSLAKSLFRRINRTLDQGDDIWYILKRVFDGTYVSQYRKMYPEIDNARKSVMDQEYEELDESYGYKPQPILFSDDDVYINYDKWKSGECKSVLITSISGSGKSTLAKKIADEFNAYYVEIDVISFGLLNPQRANWDYIKENDKYLYKFLKENNLTPTLMLNFTDSQDKRKVKILDKYIHWLCFERDDLDENRVVIAGSDVAASLTHMKELAEFPIVIKGTSILKSAYRKIQRTLNKGHDIWFILDHILNSNYFSMYRYRVPEINRARQAVMNQEYDEIHESFVPELIMYHGSSHKFDKVKPISFSAGNKLRDPSWAVFMLRQYDLALSYVVGNYVQEKCRENGIKYSFCAWLEKDGFMHYKPIVLADKQNFQKVKDLVRGDTVYVYTLKVPIDDKLNMIGTTTTLPEYVYSGTPKTIKRDDIVITDELLDSLITDQIDEKEFQKIKKSKPHRINRIGSWADLFIDMDKRKEMRDKVLPKIDSGEIKPGDDLSWLKEEMNNNTSPSLKLQNKRNIFLTSAGLEDVEVRRAFLSSYNKNIKDSKVLFVTAAAIDKEAIEFLKECWNDLLNIEINPQNIIEFNFDRHFTYNDFMRFDIVYICGGDENHLIKIINNSGMRESFIKAVNNGLVYIGVSAGACIASPYVKNGLNFIQNKVDVHYPDEEAIANGDVPPKNVQINLSNRQAVWIYGNTIQIIGSKTISESHILKHTFTHKELYDIYQNQLVTENSAIYIPHESGNITQYVPGAYFNEEVGVWMKKPNKEELKRLNVLNESYSGYEFHPLIEAKPAWDPKLWRDPGPNIRDFDIQKELKTFMYPQAIKEKYKGPNFYINLPGLSKDKRFRVRCEMIILDSEGRMLVDRKRTFKRMNLSYDNTGGGIDPGEEIVQAAAREAQEEARITVKDPMDSMLWYAYEVPEDSKRNYGFWGIASFICVGRKKSTYKGYIKVDDRDSFIDRAEWIKPEEIEDLLPAHKQAIEMYKQFYLQESLGINMEFLNNEYE